MSTTEGQAAGDAQPAARSGGFLRHAGPLAAFLLLVLLLYLGPITLSDREKETFDFAKGSQRRSQ